MSELWAVGCLGAGGASSRHLSSMLPWTSLASSILAKISSCCLPGCCWMNFFDGEVVNTKRSLEEMLVEVREYAKGAVGRAEVIQDVDIIFWSRQIENLMEEVSQLTRGPFWRCRNRKRLLGGIALDISMLEFEIFGTASFQRFRCTPHHFICFQSRAEVWKQLLEALEGDNYVTGLFGMQGTGKSKLAIEVGKTLLESRKFDRVIFISVFYSHCSPNIEKIQYRIAESLRMTMSFKKGKDEKERSEILWKRLMNGERILIILDDLMGEIDFERIGIPSRENHMNCRILITTVDEAVCVSMGCLRPIPLSTLPEQEGWNLFQTYAAINDYSEKKLLDKGKEISKECEGLPLAITAIASALKNQSLAEWNATLIALRSPMSMPFGESNVQIYKFLKYKYDNMKSEEAKKLLLLLSVLPGAEVHIEILARFGIGVGLFGEVDKYSNARSQVRIVKNKLIDSSLLLEAREGYVKMRVASFKANEADQVIENFDKYQMAFSTKEKKVQYLRVDDLQVEDMDAFPSRFDGTELEILQINIEASDSVELPDPFFVNMTNLRVLALSYNKSDSMFALLLPSSIGSLTNIRSLLLYHWKLEDISILKMLHSLETLDLDDCLIQELPKEITALKKLRLLSLNLCKVERNNPFEVIEGCLSLEELYFKSNKILKPNRVNEVEAIHQNRTFPTLSRYHLVEEGEDSVLSRYRMVEEGEDLMSKCICYSHIDTLISEAAFKCLIRGAKILCLKEIKGECRSLIPEIVPMEDMDALLELSLESCSNVECLINTERIGSRVLDVFPKLLGLNLASMDNLGEICRGDPPSEFLSSLRRLSIAQCDNLQGILFNGWHCLIQLTSVRLLGCSKLETLFQLSTAEYLTHLRELRIHECESLKNIITDDNDDEGHYTLFPRLRTLEINSCHKLEGILSVLCRKDMQLLVAITIVKCNELKFIFGRRQHEHQEVILSSLEKVELSSLPNLCFPLLPSSVKRSPSRNGSKKKRRLDQSSCTLPAQGSLTDGSITSVEIDQSLPAESQRLNMLIFRNMKKLEITDLHKIKLLFVLSIASSMQLEILKIDTCPELEYIVDIGDGDDGENRDAVFPKLKELFVFNCTQLEYMFGQCPPARQNYCEIYIHLPVLEKLTLHNLPKFIDIFPENSHSAMAWPPLKEFTLDGCPRFIINSISDGMIHLDSRKSVNRVTKDIRKVDKHFRTLETLNIGNNKIDTIFCLSGLQIIGQVRLGLQYLKLSNLSEMMNICGGSKDLFSFQNLKTMQIVGCAKLKVIFPASVLSCIPKLERLEIKECEELKQIIEEDVENKKSTKPCFPKLAVLLVKQCHKLKRLISASNDLPNLELLVILEASRLKELIGGEKRHDNVSIGKVKVEFPKLKVLIFMQLSSLCQGIELQNARHHVIHNCAIRYPTSTATLQEIQEKVLELDKDFDSCWLSLMEFSDIVKDDKITDIPTVSGIETMPRSDMPCPQLSATTKDNLVLKVLADLGESLKIPLKDIASSEDNSCRILTALNSLSCPPLEDKTLPDELKAIIDSLHQEFPSILSSFMQLQASATNNKIAEPGNLNELATTLALKICKAKNFINEAEKKEATLKEQIIRLKEASTDLVAGAKAQTASLGHLPSSQINEEPEKEFARKVPNSEIQATATTSKPPTELEDGQSMTEPCLMKEPKPLGEAEITIEIPQREIEQTEISTDDYSEGHPINIRDLGSDQSFMHEAPQKEEISNEQILSLENEIRESEAELSSLQEEKKKCIAETIGYEKEYENVEKRLNAPEGLFEVNRRWSALISQFQYNRIAAINPS